MSERVRCHMCMGGGSFAVGRKEKNLRVKKGKPPRWRVIQDYEQCETCGGSGTLRAPRGDDER